jgi:hypothetical protein
VRQFALASPWKDKKHMNKNSETPFGIWVNPLRFFSLEDHPLRHDDAEIDYVKLLSDLQEPDGDKSIEGVLERYKHLTSYDSNLFLVPVNNVILKKLVWPLRSAKQAFCLGNYLGCIALCGTVAEMIVIFLFEIANITINGEKLDDAAQKKLFGNTFEKLGQERRLEILEAYGILKKDLINEANQIKGIRKMYLHILSKDFVNLEQDARQVYKSASILVGEMVTLKPSENGTITVPSHLINLLGKGSEEKIP